MHDAGTQTCSTQSLEVRRDKRGALIAIESGRTIPFDIARVYYIFDVPEGVERGAHAHRELQQLVICMSGSCEILLDDGRVVLSSPTMGLSIGAMVWRQMRHFSPGSVLMVLANRPYDESDYIRDYSEFLLAAADRAAA
jgi:dTDP-4-dehydrorhamnose 3,5-epimerase-like enzyme